MSTKTYDSLTDDPLWTAAASLAEYGYSLLGSLPEEEKWDMVSKMRQHAFNLTDNMAQATGSQDPRDSMHYYVSAIRCLYGLKNVITMAKRAGYIKPDPEHMIAFEDLIAKTEKQKENSQHNIQDYLKNFDRIAEDKVKTT